MRCMLAAVVFVAWGASFEAQRTRLSPCVAAFDTINWARERIASPGATNTDLSRVLAHLELSTQNCATNGDLWYFRHVLEQRLAAGANKAAYSLKKATEWRSEALARRLDPFAPVVAARTPGPIKDRWALVVGVSRFTDKYIAPLNFTAKDAQDFQQALVEPQTGGFAPDHVRLVVDAEATLMKVREGIGWLRANVGPDDLAVVYVSSHGSPRKIDPNGVSYIMLHDTDATDPATLYASALQMIDLSEDLARDVRAGRVILILDTCYSGDAAQLRLDAAKTPFSPALSAFANAPGRVVLAAANGDQRSWESGKLKNGYFTYFLVDALRRSKGAWPLKQLFDDVQSNVSEMVRRELNETQIPLMSGSADVEGLRLRELVGSSQR